VADEARSHFGSKVFETVVPRNVRLGEAPSHGKPVLLYDIHSKGASSYLRLAEELLRRIDSGADGPAETVVEHPANAFAEPEAPTPDGANERTEP
jgi:hypothetical protein